MQPDPNAVAVTRRVRETLEAAGMSAAKMAETAGWTQSYMARRMSGAVPFSAVDLIVISNVLHIDPTRLLPTGPTLTTEAARR